MSKNTEFAESGIIQSEAKTSKAKYVVLGITAVGLVAVLLIIFLIPGGRKTALLAGHPRYQVSKGPAFNWTIRDFEALKIGNSDTSAGGTSYDEIIRKYGQPQQVTPVDSGNKDITYTVRDENNSQNIRQVELTFAKQTDGSYRLKFAEEYNLGNKNTDIAGLKNPLTAGDYKRLKVGDSKTGAGGVTLDTVFEKYGYPASIDLGMQSIDGPDFQFVDSLEAQFVYENADFKGKYVYLNFLQQKDGKNRLYQKNMDSN
ncbi:hypothetical protein NtB2_00010 [Lactococcus termiticola]|uniref:Uncharacterized protein n=2 Tax=Lactococcus termiticola TaxID=2169526 RepID=A0A2R5HI43_9LACT|nr:hypothetical protein NtB2_00010 [Lactococcus termiticola]